MGGIIKTLVTALLGGTMVSLPEIVKRVLISLGIGVATFTGMTSLLGVVKAQAFQSLSSMPSSVVNIIGILNIDTAFSIVMSAYAIKLTMRTMGGMNPKQMGLF